VSEQCAVSKDTPSVWRAVFQPWHRSTVVLLVVYCHISNILFEVSPEIHCLGVSSHCCCYGNHAAKLI